MTEKSRPITEKDWKEIAKMMDGLFGEAKLVIDGYKVTFQQQMSKRKLVTMTFVNGVFKGEWMATVDYKKPDAKHEEAKRFFMLRSKRIYPEKEIKKIQRVWGKKEANKHHEERVYGFDPCWKSARSLRKHLEANNKDIRVIEIRS